jgi:AGCS family alanine or glycine:cation symporter
MALPNLIGLLILSGFIARETSKYLAEDPHLTAIPVPAEGYVPPLKISDPDQQDLD